MWLPGILIEVTRASKKIKSLKIERSIEFRNVQFCLCEFNFVQLLNSSNSIHGLSLIEIQFDWVRFTMPGVKVSPEWRSKLGFRTQRKCPFPLNRGVPSIEVTDTKIIYLFIKAFTNQKYNNNNNNNIIKIIIFINTVQTSCYLQVKNSNFKNS